MVGIATYLSFNLWIRGFSHFSLTLIMVAVLEINNTYTNPVSVLSICSKVLILFWVTIVTTIYIHMIKLFAKKKVDSEKLPKNLLELYEPLQPKASSVVTYNILFIAKRIIFVCCVVFMRNYSGKIQLYVNISTIVVCAGLSIICIRFKNPFTMAFYYITETITLLSLVMVLWYDNTEIADLNIGLNQPHVSIDRIIVIFISLGVVIIFLLFLVEVGLN